MSLADISPVFARTSLADAVYDTLMEGIVGGTLAAGTELKVVALAEQLQVSRTPVKEALGRLAKDGLVQWTTGRKPRVARFNRDDVIEIYEVRECLEAMAAARAAVRMSPEVLDQLAEHAEQLAEGIEDVDWGQRAMEWDLQFHAAVAQASDNRRLTADIKRYRLLVRGFCRMTGKRENLKQAFSEHLDILAALQSRDAATAREAMAKHIRARLASVLEELDAPPSDSP